MIWQMSPDSTMNSRLCLMLLHSIWQVTLFALTASVIGRLWRRRSVEREYAVQVVALLASVVAMPMTFASVSIVRPHAVEVAIVSGPSPAARQGLRPDNLRDLPASAGVAPTLHPTTNSTPFADSRQSFWVFLSPWVAVLYGVGVILMLARLAVGVWQANRLGRRGQILGDGALFELVRSMAAKWLMPVVPAIVRVEEIFIPKVVGLVWPKILVPASAFTGLSAADLEMLLIHELAHLRRHDMWVNLLQRLAEAVLFFNPAAWYLSRRISSLREFCCDEMTCRAMVPSRAHARTDYALALLRVVELAHHSMERHPGVGSAEQDDLMALAANGRSPSQLRQRVASLFGEPVRDPLRLSVGGMVMVVALALLLLFGPASLRMAADAASDRSPDNQIIVSRETAIAESDGPQGASKSAPSSSAPRAAGKTHESDPIKSARKAFAESASANNPPRNAPEISEPVFIVTAHLILHEGRVSRGTAFWIC
jgi:beta-lactamase regulating signal transducer with metallopeptidase domain